MISKRVLVVVALLLVQLELSSAALAQDLSPPEKNFQSLWETFDRNYALFGAKKIDWNAVDDIPGEIVSYTAWRQSSLDR